MSSTGANPQSSAGVPVHRGDLAGLDDVQGETLAVFCWEDVRPLKGVAGYLDWRLNGALSEAILSGAFEGKAGEVMLLPATGRLGRKRVFAFGLGPLGVWTPDSLRQSCYYAGEVMRRAGASAVLLCAPATTGRCDIETAFIAAVGQELRTPPGFVGAVLVEDPSSV